MKFGLRFPRHARAFCAATAALGVLLAPGDVQAQAVLLVCTLTSQSNITMNVTIDYASNTVSMTIPGTTQLAVDGQGRSAFPAQISEQGISWQQTWQSPGSVCGAHCFVSYSLNRMTGYLSTSGNGGGNFVPYNCAVGAPKF
ncbi:MAG TPA: hypothetical protein VNF99_08375 [Stellaceae bacterium]|nr:hypothetical protein [Stellaceae bacterium]